MGGAAAYFLARATRELSDEVRQAVRPMVAQCRFGGAYLTKAGGSSRGSWRRLFGEWILMRKLIPLSLRQTSGRWLMAA